MSACLHIKYKTTLLFDFCMFIWNITKKVWNEPESVRAFLFNLTITCRILCVRILVFNIIDLTYMLL